MSLQREPDVHRGRPTRPEHRERGERLMAQWAEEDADKPSEVDPAA